MTVDRMRGWFVPLVAACLVGFTAQKATGQTVVTGKVTNQYGAPVSGATVLIPSLQIGGATNDSGTYAITIPSDRVRGQSVTATARYIGYAPLSQSITLTAGSHTLDFALKADPFQLNAVVTTGVADSTSSKNLTFTVAKVTSAQVEAVPASDALSALTGKVAGLMVSPGTGSPGSDPAIRLRGSTCLQVGCSAPLVIVDGVITTESISDLDVNNIQSMEILKGAAGASFYGSNAANGVISITTKSGRDLAENHVSVTAHAEYGANSIAHYPSFNHGTRNTFDPTTGEIILDAGGNAVTSGSAFDDTPYPTFGPNRYRDQMKLWTNSNDYYNSNVSVGLRRGNTNFNTSFSSDHNGGIVPFRSGQFRQNVRLNIDQGLGDKADLSTSVTYGVQNLSNGGDWFALYQAPPDIDLRHPPNSAGDTTTFYPILPGWSDPSQRGNPLYALSVSSSNANSQHFLGSVSARYRPTSWLRLEGNYGTDRLYSKNVGYTPRGTIGGSGQHNATGSYSNSSNDDVSWNSMVRATGTKLYKDILSTTSVAYQLENSNHSSFSASASQLTVNDVPNLEAGDNGHLNVGSQQTIERTTDYMVSQDFNVKDRYLLTGLYRRDGSSLFGSNDRWRDFYRVSGAYRVTQDFHIPGFQELKIHVAQGTAGLRPGYFDQYETYSISNGKFSKNTLGNKDLRPAVLTETEYGINADFLDRFTAELTYSNQRTDGAFLNVPISVAAYGGFVGKWENAANISGKTLEGALQTRVLDRRDLSWDVTVTADHTTQSITHMDVAPFPVSAGGQGQGVFWYQSGEDLGVIYGTKFVRTIAEAVANNNPKYPSTTASDYVVNPLGYVVLAANRGTAAERPIPYVDASGNDKFVIGNVNPKLNYGFNNDIRWKRFGFHGLFSGQVGGSVYNFSKQWRFQDLRAGDMDMTNVPDAQKVAEAFFTQGLYNGLDPANYFVESGAYLKLQELSVSYDVNPRLLSRVGLGNIAGLKLSVLGRNLYTWTSYSGFDPDVTSGSDFNFKIDGFRYPPFRSFTGQIQVRF